MVTQSFQRANNADFELVPTEEGTGARTPFHSHSTRWVRGTVVMLVSFALMALAAAMLLPRPKADQHVVASPNSVSAENTEGIVALSEKKDSKNTKSTDEATSFDCDAGYKNWKKGWSLKKKTWCCENENLGCPDIDWQFTPAMVVDNFTASDNDTHEHCLSVTEGDVVFIHEKHSSKWTYVYARWLVNSTHGWVPHWALNENTSKVERSFDRDESKAHHKDCVSVKKDEQVFAHQSEGGWTWITKLEVIDKEFQKVHGWVPDWALTIAEKDEKEGEKEDKDEDKEKDDDNKDKDDSNKDGEEKKVGKDKDEGKDKED